MPPKSKAHHHRSGQNNVKKAHNKKRGAGPNQPAPQLLASKGKKKQNNKSGNGDKNSKATAPKLVCFVALHDSANPYLLKTQCLKQVGYETEHLPYSPVTVNLPPWAQTSAPGAGQGTRGNQRMTFWDIASRDKFHILDAAKVADVVVLCMGPHGSLESRPFDDIGYETLSCLKSQGVPTVVGAMQGLGGDSSYQSMVEQLFSQDTVANSSCSSSSSSSTTTTTTSKHAQQMLSKKQKQAMSKLVQRFFESEFPNGEKFFECSTPNDLTNFVRHVSNTNLKDLAYRKDRGYMLIEQAEPNFENDKTKLKLSGFLRGSGICSNNLVHLTGVGDFPVLEIATADGKQRRVRMNKVGTVEGGSAAVSEIQRLQPYDPSQNEQHLGEQEANNDCAMDGAGDADAMTDIPDAAEGAVPTMLGTAGLKQRDEDEDSDFSFSDLNEELFRYAEECPTKKTMEFEERALEDLDFPDEVDTPLPPAEAKIRFQKYRGLRSLKTSPWDRYEDLPLEYSRIWEFDGFKSCVNAAKEQHAEDVEQEWTNSDGNKDSTSASTSSSIKGQYVHIVIGNITEAALEKLKNLNMVRNMTLRSTDGELNSSTSTSTVVVQGPVILSTLFEHEHQVSVMHFQIHRTTAGTDSLTTGKTLDRSIKSKTETEFHCGFRRFLARPIFSQLPKKSCAEKDKHLYQRYCHPGQSCVASVYAPILFPPCTVLMFEKEAGDIDRVCSSNSSGETKNVEKDDGHNMQDQEMRMKQDDTTMMTDDAKSTSTTTATTALNNTMNQKNVSGVTAWTAAGEKNLLAWGEVIDANPKKIIVKRCILAGYPFRVHKNKAVVRHMFFKPDDIRWFRPVELRTKHGLRGNIRESLGTHGYMKCIFGDRIKQNDTICMDLYKRQYPKWHPVTWGGNPNNGPDSEALA
ncbi:unnamed protein product [Amoebophrya sp. A120]|nr:unnamed protein product [Amoebophrya sp. A120]|eukprot:GSA120T00024621001.1